MINFFSAHWSILQSQFWSLLVIGLANGLIYAMVAIGYTLVYGVLRLINFAHSEVVMSGAFGGYFVLRETVGSTMPTGFASFGYVLLGAVSGALVGAVVATFVERIAYRPLRKRHAPKIAFLISAIGASYFLVNLAGKEFGRYNTALPLVNNNVAFTFLGAQIQTYYIVIAIVSLIMLVLLDRFVSKSKLGRSIRAVAQDAETASLMGVNIDRTIALTFIIGGALGGVAGFMIALNTGAIYTMGFVPALKAFTAAVLGGIGNLRGAVIGGLLLGVVESLSVAFVDPAFIDVVAFAILVLVLLFRPTGILGERLGRAA